MATFAGKPQGRLLAERTAPDKPTANRAVFHASVSKPVRAVTLPAVQDPTELVEDFLAGCSASRRTELDGHEELPAILTRLLEDGRSAWPDVSITPRVFIAHLAERIADDGDGLAALNAVRAADLYLACGCLHADPRALEAAEREVFPAARPALHKIDAPEVEKEDAIQRLRHLVLFGDGDRPPKIAKYSGRGALKSWVSVAAVRHLLTSLRDGREDPTDEDALVRRGAYEDNPELSRLKDTYRAEFKSAFEDAFAALSSRSRVLLRHYYVDDLSSEELARLHRVHRVTITRWLQRIREELLIETRERLKERLNIGGEELESIMRLIQSELHVSILGMLGDRGHADE